MDFSRFRFQLALPLPHPCNDNQSQHFPLALDKSMDVADFNQLMIFVPQVGEDFCVNKELLKIHSLKGGKEVLPHRALNSIVCKYGGFNKCFCIVIDCAKVLAGRNTSLIGLF